MFSKKINPTDVSRRYDLLKKEIGGYRMHIKAIISSIDKKIMVFRDKYMLYKERKELQFASIYMKETGNLRVLKNILQTVDLGLLAVNLRLDTMKIVVSALLEFKESTKVINKVVGDIRLMNDNFNDYYKSFINGYFDLETLINIPELDLANFLSLENEDALKIIQTVERTVGEELAKRFPNVPADLDQILSEDPKEGVKKLYEILATDGGVRENKIYSGYMGRRDRRLGSSQVRDSILKVNPRMLKRIDLSKLEKKEIAILKYIINIRKGEFGYTDIYQLAKITRSSPETVLQSLYDLAELKIIHFSHGM